MANQKLDFNRLLPSSLKNEMSEGLMSNLFNRFVSNENSVLVNGRIGRQVPGDAKIIASDLDRELNALVPAIYTKVGTQETAHTFSDLVNKMRILGIDVESMRNWMQERSYNWSVPICYDKFTNYTNYYWVGKQMPFREDHPWNTDLDPEYYVIKRPKRTDTTKMPVRVVATAPIKLYANNRQPETFTVVFTSNTTFIVTSNLGPVVTNTNSIVNSEGSKTPVIIGLNSSTPLCSMVITVGTSQFSSGDFFTVTIKYFTSQITVALSSLMLSGKGTITGIKTESPVMSIDGVQLQADDRVLVTSQTNPSENGIYKVVIGEKWVRTSDANDASTILSGSQVYVTNGSAKIGTTWTLVTLGNGSDPFSVDDPTSGAIVFAQTSSTAAKNVNQWQEFNCWIHKDDFNLYNDTNYDFDSAVQAVRPIIEYDSDLQLNSSFDAAGFPNDAARGMYEQKKIAFNQIPQFDLFKYDGSHAGKTSGIFFYEEDPSAVLDVHVGRRAVTNENGDFIFGVGLTDTDGSFLYYKKSGSICSLWQPGPVSPLLISKKFIGGSNRGNLNITSIAQIADSQSWSLTAASATTFTVEGSRSGKLPNATVGTQYMCDDLAFVITSGSANYMPGEKFTFEIVGLTGPRYVKKGNTDTAVINYPGGPSADLSDGPVTGIWLTPERMFQNLLRESRGKISYGDLINHTRSVIRSQNNFSGVSFGNNNARFLDFNAGLGGKIKEFSGNFQLLISMLSQREISPLAILDFAEQQYNLALASVDQFLINNLADYFSSQDAIGIAQIDPNDTDIQKLLSVFELNRAADTILTEAFRDSNSGVKNWPLTLPQAGLWPKTMPKVQLDPELNLWVIVHHDGHNSPAATRDADFDRQLVKSIVTRSDGQQTPGIFSETAPSSPYAGQLWMKPSVLELRIFDVVSDEDTPPPGVAGAYWFIKSQNTLKKWSITDGAWQDTSEPVASRWLSLDVATIRNSLILAIENKLYAATHPLTEIKYDVLQHKNSPQAEFELAKFAATYNYDTYAPDYIAEDAFTWNYTNAVISGLGNVPGRWHAVYKSYYAAVGLPETSRPDLEPWKLTGATVEPSGWRASYANTTLGRATDISIRGVKVSNHTPLAGLPSIDGTVLSSGDVILLVSQIDPSQNGLWKVSSGLWTRDLSLILPSGSLLEPGFTVAVTDGVERSGTRWTLTNNPSSNQVWKQTDRPWTDQMWDDILTAKPGLKLCVNPRTDELLPPYVNPSKFESAFALLNTIPSGADSVYVFGDSSPVETVWKKSVEYGYGLCRAAFKRDPMNFLLRTWGDTYVSAGSASLRVSRNTLKPLAAKDFMLHGEKLQVQRNLTADQVAKTIQIMPGGGVSSSADAVVEFTVGYCGFENKTVFDVTVNGNKVGYVDQGQVFDIPLTGGVSANDLKIVDNGLPFSFGDKLLLELTPTTAVLSYAPSKTAAFFGLCQWYTNFLRFNYIDASISDTVTAYKGWDLKLAYRLGTMIRPDNLTISSDLGQLPITAYTAIVKRAERTRDFWISALRIQLTQMGSRTLNSEGIYVPSSDASDWVFRVESYNPKNPVIQKYTHNTSGPSLTFTALGEAHTNRPWLRYTEKNGYETVTMPKSITGLQNVINFVYGYIDYLTDQGWSLLGDDPTVDAQTGRNLDWQLEIEKLVDVVYTGISAGYGHIINPFMDKIVLNTPIGLQSEYSKSQFVDAYSSCACWDVGATTIPLRNLTVIRTDDRCVTRSDTPIYSVHTFLDEYEHCILLNTRFLDDNSSPVIFDSFLGSRIDTAYLTYIKNDASNRKPVFDGFFINGNTVSRNIVSGIDTIGKYYDADSVHYEQEVARHSTSLLGYTPKDYFNGVFTTPAAQFNFWRGLIQAKGTNMTVDAFVNYKKFTSARVDEYWAYKLAEFGDARERSQPEIKINTGDVTQKLARFQFHTEGSTVAEQPMFTQIYPSDDSRWVSLDDLGTGLKFEAGKISETVTISEVITQPTFIRLKNIYHSGDTAAPVVTGSGSATVLGSCLLKITSAQPGTVFTVTGYTWLNPTKFSPIKLFDYQESTLISEIPLWHPAIGLHAPAALELINITGSIDPANYNYSTQTTNNPNFRQLKPWAAREVGRVWWDTTNLGFIPYYDSAAFKNLDARESRWGTLAEWATINLYQWTASPVPPSEYDALAAATEGDSEIDASVRLNGRAALKQTYARDRIIKIRPIAWSHASVNNEEAHPAFGPAEFTSVYASGNVLIADSGRTEQINLISGRNFGGWDIANNKPVGEVEIGEEMTYYIGSSINVSIPSLVSGNSNIESVKVVSIEGGNFGRIIGQITLSKIVAQDGTVSMRMSSSTELFQDTEISAWWSSDNSIDGVKVISFDTFGLNVILTRSSTAVQLISAADQVNSVTLSSNDIYIREGVNYTEIVPLPAELFVNDSSNYLYSTTEYEWRTWELPSQTQLSRDFKSPKNEWLAYLGDEVIVNASPELIETMAADPATYTLVDGSTISRYTSDWTNWLKLTDIRQEKISNGISVINFTFDDAIEQTRLSLYANGIQINPGNYTISANTVACTLIYPEGVTVMALHRAYSPTENELLFDPEISDDIEVQTQYKVDYQYTSVVNRDETGNVTGQTYYFWVKDKSVPLPGKSMSLLKAAQILKNGPDNYAILSRLLPDGMTAAYDSLAIAGLGMSVTKNDAFKLRFLRDFTLRDDPEELSLKNVHTEWTLIRRTQSAKIPQALWNKITDAAAGSDVGGAQLPSQVRIDYDIRNGTRERYGFKPGQIFADTDIVRSTIINTILNTELTIQIGNKEYPDYINSLDLDQSGTWFADAASARQTMSTIWNNARPAQINEIFFNVLEDALANNFEFSDLFKTSLITVSSDTLLQPASQQEQTNGIF